MEKIILKNNSRVAVLGGGPGGAFFAIHLLRLAKKAGINIGVTIIEPRLGSGTVAQTLGCNMCDGVISPRLQTRLAKEGIGIPEAMICQRFTHIWIHGLWKNFPLKAPEGASVFSVFSGGMPQKRAGSVKGLDSFFLEKALEQGAQLLRGTALNIEYGPSSNLLVWVDPSGKAPITLEADFVCIATGVNSYQGGEDRLLASYRRINPLFVPPETRAALTFELKPGHDYLKKFMDRELYLIVSGADQMDLDHAALVPKGQYLTICLVGGTIDRAACAGNTTMIIAAFLALPNIQKILPGIQEAPIVCTCSSRMVVAPARGAVAHRMAMVGDALGAKIYRDGLFSAFVSARALAQTLVYQGLDKQSLEKGYDWVYRWLKTENKYGKRIITLFQAVLKSPLGSRILYQAFATEMKFKDRENWPLGNLLWKIAGNGSDYREVYRGFFCLQVFRSVITGMVKTFRNFVTEGVLGLKWEAHGRYPTVVIREKREEIKASIAGSLGINLNAAYEMERMYAVKIRASAHRIYTELGKFGDPAGKFLNLRFIDVKRVSGRSNHEGSIIQYRSRLLPVSMDIQLVRALSESALLYKPGALFALEGRLIFHIRPTRDKNHRLVVYTAFDFKRGTGFWGRLFWWVFRNFFPDYVHDVIWNHAICCIKREAETI